MLPTIYKEKLDIVKYAEIYLKFELPNNKKIIFYPAQFWAHKNHKYIIDVAEILKSKKYCSLILFICLFNISEIFTQKYEIRVFT